MQWQLERLRTAGVDEVLVVDLGRPEFQVPVVRVIVPGLEGVDGAAREGRARARSSARESARDCLHRPERCPPRPRARNSDAIYLPPVSQGDVYRACAKRPEAIAIIDGYFERVPAVWHKEILWAMSQGIQVFGSSSMGALRAAELARIRHGRGRGRLRSLHGMACSKMTTKWPWRTGRPTTAFAPVSEAMVNIRATFREATQSAIISGATQAALVTIGEGLFYAERTYPAVLENARNAGVDDAELDRLQAWLPGGRVDQKRRDAVQMLGTSQTLPHKAAHHCGRPSRSNTLTCGSRWALVRAGSAAPRRTHTERPEAGATIPVCRTADLRRTVGPRLRARGGARGGAAPGCSPGADQVAARAARFRDARQLSADDAFVAWLAAQHLSEDEFFMLMADEVRLDQV